MGKKVSVRVVPMKESTKLNVLISYTGQWPPFWWILLHNHLSRYLHKWNRYMHTHTHKWTQIKHMGIHTLRRAIHKKNVNTHKVGTYIRFKGSHHSMQPHASSECGKTDRYDYLHDLWNKKKKHEWHMRRASYGQIFAADIFIRFVCKIYLWSLRETRTPIQNVCTITEYIFKEKKNIFHH